MNPEKLDSSGYFKALQIVHLALVAGVAFFALISFTLVSGGTLEPANKELDKMLKYVVPVFMMLGMLFSNLMFRLRLKECLGQRELKNKLELYRGALIVRYAGLEGPAFFAIVAFMLTGNPIYLGFAGLMVVVLLVNRPTREKAMADLEME